MQRKLRVVISGLHYPLTMMSYFIRAFERREDVELATAGPFTGNWIPWANGMQLPMKYVKTPTIPLPRDFIGVGRLNPAVVQSQLPWEPDLWLQVDAGFYFDPKPKAGIVAHVATDPHCLNYDRQRSLCDIFFNMQRAYLHPNDKYLPYAFDPTVHYPEDLPKEYDTCLVGLQYEQRCNLVGALRRNGITVKDGLGLVFDEYRQTYNKSRIALNWSSLLDMNARFFEAFGLGLPLVTNRLDAYDDYFREGEHYLGFSNVEEAVKQAKILLADKDMRDEMAGNAHRKALAGHTYDYRICQILETCKLR